MKQEFEMTQEEMDEILAIKDNSGPVMKIDNIITGMDLPERINRYWEGLADKYGFHQMTVEGSSKGRLFFLAEPKPKVIPKTPLELDMDKYDTLQKIVDQLESCEYENQAGVLRNNTAFLKLKQMAKD